ncbi:hypothetical protein GFY24_02535 [Nocardia sp. SYP-A9097]|uniref:hypothetical protein n=1 Tax=Nocardia sp. SYP-A9097 TaxID=2663237 RepID=UPI00129A91E0|nr:hypothetical protein [Nocardia sp. SYP-A9097]MRH86354.1 hypothetical protein [Nocardia sp. SYP-A9097]
MSHQLATQAAGSSRRAAQVLRYSAIVTAAMASIGLTVAAGSYIANEMAGTQKSGTIIAAPARSHDPAAASGITDPLPADSTAISDNIGLAAFFTPHTIETAGPQSVPIPAAGYSGEVTGAARPSAIAGQLRLGSTYVGAVIVPAQRNSVSVTVDTNVFATVADLVQHTPLGENLGLAADPATNTQLRTDVDTRSGEVTFTLSDPTLGRYGVQLVRHNTPATQDISIGHATELGRAGGSGLITV